MTIRTTTEQGAERTISERIYTLGQQLAGAAGSELANTLNQALNTFLGPRFRAGPGSMVDSQGRRTGTFGTLIRTTGQDDRYGTSIETVAERVACVIDVSESLNVESLRMAYTRIADAKCLKKAPRSPQIMQTNITLGIIFAVDVSIPLETLAEELDRLNRTTPSSQWADMVVIISQGVINYAVQFPGEGMSGDFLPPAEGALLNYTPPVYIITVVRPTGKHSFNKMCSFLVAHLSLFSPGSNVPRFLDVLEGVPGMALTLCGYQYNLRGELVPVPRQYYQDRYLPPRPMRIQDKQGKLLATLQFLPWQDGGTLLLRGKLPLDGLMLLLGEDALRRGGVTQRKEFQISHVLPITQQQFLELLQKIQLQSNMIVANDETKFVVQKFADEGSRSPFMARLFMGILRLRQQVYPDETKQNDFDKSFDFVLTQLLNSRAAEQEIVRSLKGHAEKVANGENAKINGHSIHIEENIDTPLGRLVDDFLNCAVRTLKHGMQTLTNSFQIDTGFLFQKSGPFATGLAALAKHDPLLANYLQYARVWSERLLESRNAIEHKGWKLPKVTYSVASGKIQLAEPEILGSKATEFVKFTLDRLICFVEEVTTHCLQTQMPAGISITEIALSDRDPEAPMRFQPAVSPGGMPIWRISYHQNRFEDS